MFLCHLLSGILLIYSTYILILGHTIAKVVSRWLPTVAARVRTRVWQVGFVVDTVASGQFSPSTSVSPAKTVHSAKFSIIITITRGS
jgi:hypothetical protein